jgi:hypothetical protein
MPSSNKRGGSSRDAARGSKKAKKVESAGGSGANRGSSNKSGSSRKRLASEHAATADPSRNAIKQILILDSGGWEVKHGLIPVAEKIAGIESPLEKYASCHEGCDQKNDRSKNAQLIIPGSVPNAVAKMKHQLAVLVGDQIKTVSNKSQLDVTRSVERGYCTNPGVQLKVWNRILELERISTPATKNTLPEKAKVSPTISSSACCCTLLTQPFAPCTIDEITDELIFDDLGFSMCAKVMGQCMAAFMYSSDSVRSSRRSPSDTDDNIISNDCSGCCCVVDSGFSLTHIVPTVNSMAFVS